MAGGVNRMSGGQYRDGYTGAKRNSRGAKGSKSGSRKDYVTAEDVRLERVANMERPLSLVEFSKTMQVPFCTPSERAEFDSVLKKQQAAGRMPAFFTTDMMIAISYRMSNPRSSSVPVPVDYRSAEQLKWEQMQFEAQSDRQDTYVYDAIAEANARNRRWEREKPEYERRVKEAEVINNICAAAVEKLSAPPAVKAKMAPREIQKATQQLQEIALTGHLRGVSEALLGSQAETCKNYETYYRSQRLAPEQGSEYLYLKHHEYLRAHPEAQYQQGPLTFTQIDAGMDPARVQRPAQVGYKGDSGLPVDANHPNRYRVKEPKRDTVDLRVEPSEGASSDMNNDYPK